MSHNVTTFDTVKKLQAAAFVSANHLEAQFSGNPVKHIATSVNLNFGSGIATYDVAAGWYGYSRRMDWHYQCLLGIGYNSNLFLRDPNQHGLFDRSTNGFDVVSLYNRYYIQPAISYEADFGYYDIRYGFSLACRASYLYFQRFQYREIDADRTIDLDHPVYVVNKTYRGKVLWAFEPAVIHTITRGPFAVTLQLQAITPYSREIDVRNIKFSPGLLFSTGVVYSLKAKRKG